MLRALVKYVTDKLARWEYHFALFMKFLYLTMAEYEGETSCDRSSYSVGERVG